MFWPFPLATHANSACYAGSIPPTCLRMWLVAANCFVWMLIVFAIYRLLF